MRARKTGHAVDLGKWLGRRQAFALRAAAGTAVDAECLRRGRHGRHHHALAPSFRTAIEPEETSTCGGCRLR